MKTLNARSFRDNLTPGCLKTKETSKKFFLNESKRVPNNINFLRIEFKLDNKMLDPPSNYCMKFTQDNQGNKYSLKDFFSGQGT